MGYKVTARVKVDLSELGDNAGTPFFVEIQNPKLLVWGQKMEAAKFQIPEGKKLTPEETKEMMAGMKDYVFGFIKSWNLLSMEDETPLTLDSPAVLDKVPALVVEKIIQKFQESNAQTVELQKN